MANQSIQTKIRTSNKTIHLQEFWVRFKGELQVSNVFFEGDLTKTTPQVLDAIQKAKVIIIGPSNPISSLGPILAIHPLRNALRNATGFRIAISPIIGSSAVSGPTAAFLNAWGKTVSPAVIAELYHDIIDGLVIHNTDKQYEELIQEMGVTPFLDNIYIQNREDAIRIMQRIMESK